MEEPDILKRRRALDAARTVIVSTVRSDGPDLTQRQLAVLLTVASCPDFGVKELAAELEVGKGPITRALDTLTTAGFLERRPHDDDARLVRLWVKPEGRAFLANLGDIIVGAFRGEPASATATHETFPGVR